jgi:hypothetical protein
MALVTLRPLSFNVARRRTLADLPPALGRFFIASARTLTKGIVAGQGSNSHGTVLEQRNGMRASRGRYAQGVGPRPATIRQVDVLEQVSEEYTCSARCNRKHLGNADETALEGGRAKQPKSDSSDQAAQCRAAHAGVPDPPPRSRS